jgi:hypothetical protein
LSLGSTLRWSYSLAITEVAGEVVGADSRRKRGARVGGGEEGESGDAWEKKRCVGGVSFVQIEWR